MKTLGFPRMHKEKNERRDFLPSFFRTLRDEDAYIYLENGYGSGMGISEDEYLRANPNIRFVSNKECYEQDIVLVLRCPESYEFDYMKDGSILISMLHYSTRPMRIERLKSRNIYGVSLDSIRNDSMERIVVNYKGTSYTGVHYAFKELSQSMEDFYSEKREAINVSIVGIGMVGSMAARASGKYGDRKIMDKMNQINAKGVVVHMLPRNITSDRDELSKILRKTDLLIDASNRDDPARYIIDNELLGELKPHSVILDLSADPYVTDIYPIHVKGIEGIPTGTLDKFVFYPDDEEYKNIPAVVSTKNRNTVVSCNAWPGVSPVECMKLYGAQLSPIIKTIIRNSIDKFSEHSDSYFMRAAYRATVEYFEKEQEEDENLNKSTIMYM